MSAIEEEINKRADSLIQKDGKLSRSEAITRVLNSDVALYKRWRSEARNANGVHVITDEAVAKRGEPKEPTVEDAVSRHILEQAKTLAVNEGIPLDAAIGRVVASGKGKALYEIVRDPHEASKPLVKAEPSSPRRPLTQLELEQEAQKIADQEGISLDEAKARLMGGRPEQKPENRMLKREVFRKAERLISHAISTERDPGNLDAAMRGLREVAESLPGPLAKRLAQTCSDFLATA